MSTRKDLDRLQGCSPHRNHEQQVLQDEEREDSERDAREVHLPHVTLFGARCMSSVACGMVYFCTVHDKRRLFARCML